ncbi:MAG TPA: hypothetical protein VK698_31935 [Kofleriaceae bacterium]|nr:hypothetical protein [Kofleriaceae bacterium]
MSRDDRDRPRELDDDAPATPAEQAKAEAFGRWLDGLAAGEPLPPAMDSDDRALLETATMVLASSHAVELAPERARRLVDQALEAAVLGRRSVGLVHGDAGDRAAPTGGLVAVRPATPGAEDEPESAGRSITDLVTARRRRADRVLRNLPWAVASLAAAAAVVLFVTRPAEELAAPRAAIARPIRLSVSNTSRPADPLIGIIARRDAGSASERLDVLFSDRMDGYRDLRLRRALGKEQP